MKTFLSTVLLMVFYNAIYAQIVVIPDFAVSQNLGQEIFYPSVAVSPDRRFGFSWGDDRNGVNGTGDGRGRIYSQLYNTDGNPSTNTNSYTDNIQYNSTYDNFSILRSSCAFLPNSTFVVAWHVGGYTFIGSRNDDIYYSAFNTQAQKIVAGTQLNIMNGGGTNPYASRPQLEIIPPSQFAVVYEYDNFNGSEIAATTVDANTGAVVGGAAVISDSKTSLRIYPSIASNGPHTVSVWTDARTDNYGDIYMQRFVNGVPVGGNTIVNDNLSNGTYNQWSRVAMNAEGKFVVIWLDTRSSNGGDIYAQHYDANGQKIAGNIKLTNSNSILHAALPGIDIKDNKYVITWSDSIPTKLFTCKARYFNFGGVPASDVFELSNASNNSSSYYPDVALGTSLAFFTWDDRRDSPKGRVYGKILTLNSSSIGLNTEPFGNLIVYPNPATENLWISNYVHTKNNKAEIYTLEGRLISTVEIIEEKINIEHLEAGIYLLKTEKGYARFCKTN
jgi:hypothetical protein